MIQIAPLHGSAREAPEDGQAWDESKSSYPPPISRTVWREPKLRLVESA
jgi:hypothetical protein